MLNEWVEVEFEALEEVGQIGEKESWEAFRVPVGPGKDLRPAITWSSLISALAGSPACASAR